MLRKSWSRWGLAPLVSLVLLSTVAGHAYATGREEAVDVSAAGAARTVDERLTTAERFQVPAVDARVDRIWRAVPGLPGFSLNRTRSKQLTADRADGKVWLVWDRQAPTRSLRALPPEPVYRAPDRERAVCLMFNVSWGEEYVPSILHTLAHYHIRGTFFLDGQWVQKYPELARRIASEGNAVGTHGRGHPDFRGLTNASLRQQFRSAADQWQSVSGDSIHRLDLFAPPSGAFDMRAVRLAREQGMYTILWTADTVDWRRPPASVIVSRAVTRAVPGAFILMHPTASTAQALPSMIKQLERRGYLFKTVEDVVHERPIVVPPSSLS